MELCFRAAIVSIGLQNSVLQFIALASVFVIKVSTRNTDENMFESAGWCYSNASNFYSEGIGGANIVK
jgi:hypothetical protein